MTSIIAGHIILTLTQPVGSGRPQQGSNLGPPHQESCALSQLHTPLKTVGIWWMFFSILHLHDVGTLLLKRSLSWESHVTVSTTKTNIFCIFQIPGIACVFHEEYLETKGTLDYLKNNDCTMTGSFNAKVNLLKGYTPLC